jgi:hypothetical protein
LQFSLDGFQLLCIPYATETHIRSELDDGSPIDLDRAWKMFAQIGFKGFMSAEYEGRKGGN